MKQSKKLLSMILAVIMVLSSVSIVASARENWLDDAISYNSIDKADLTPEQYATAALDEVDRMLSVEQIILPQDEIMVGELDLTSIDNALDSINTILNGSLWTQFKGLLGDLSKLNISALTERRRSSTDSAVIYSLLKFLYDNNDTIFVPFIKGELDMGTIVTTAVPKIAELSVSDMAKEALYKVAYPGQTVPNPINKTVDTMVQDLINSKVAERFPKFANYTDLLDLSAGSTWNTLNLGLKAIYNVWVVPKANSTWLPKLEEELAKHPEELAKYSHFFNISSDGKINFTIPSFTFSTDTFFNQINNIIGSIVNSVLAPDLGFSWESGGNDMIISNIINIGIEVLSATGDEFFESFVDVKTREELENMTDMEIVSYVARTIINSSVEGVWVPESADTLIKVANYTVKDLMAVNIPERDFSSASAYPVDQISTLYNMLADFGVKALNDNPGLGLSYGIGIDELGKQALAWVIDEWGGLLSGITLNKNDSVWNNVDKILKVILDNYSWFDATQFPSGRVTFESLVKNVIIENVLNLNFTPLFNLIGNQPSTSELHNSPKVVLLHFLARTANLVFPGFFPTVNTFEALIEKNTLGNMVGTLFTDLYSYRSTLVPAVVPIVCTALGLTTEQKFKTPDFDLDDFYYTSAANIDFKITNRSSGINTAYTDRNGVQHKDSRYTIKLESITCPGFNVSTPSTSTLKGGESTTVKITGTVTGSMFSIVTVTYNVLTEDGTALTTTPLTARLYTCISKATTDQTAEWTTTSGTYQAKGGNTSIYGTSPSILDDLSFKIQNTSNNAADLACTSSGTSSAASKVVTAVSFVKLNPDTVKALAGGSATVKPYVLDGYEGTDEQKAEAFGTYGFQKYTQTVGVGAGGTNITKQTNICLYNDFGLNDLFHDEVNAQRQASDYDSAAFTAYLAAMSAAATVVQTPKNATNFINTRTAVAAAACPAAKYEAAYLALKEAVDAVEASATGGVTSLKNYIDTIDPSNEDLEYDDAGYSFFGAANYKTYTWSNYRSEARAANSFVEYYTTEDEETGVTPIPTALDVAYKQHRLSLYYGRLLPVATVKTQLARAIREANARGFVQSDYTEESWADYQRALNFATATNNQSSAVQKKVNTAYVELIEGQKRLIEVGGEDEQVTVTTVAQNPGNSTKAPVLVDEGGEKILLGVYPESSGIEIADYFNVQGGTATFNYDQIATGETVTVKDGSGSTILTFKIAMLGDVDGDGDVGASDGAAIAQAGAGYVTFTGAVNYAGDVDNSGDVTSSDAAAVSQAAAGIADIDFSNVG